LRKRDFTEREKKCWMLRQETVHPDVIEKKRKSLKRRWKMGKKGEKTHPLCNIR